MEENRKGPGVFYAVVGVATLVVAIIGATFAYFSAAATDNTIQGNTSAAGGITLTVTPVGSTSANMIPVNFVVDQTLVSGKTDEYVDYNDQFADALGTSKGGSQCKDENSSNVCQVYTIKVTNGSSSNTIKVRGTLNLDGATNMKWQLLSASNATTRAAYATVVGEGVDGDITVDGNTGGTATGDAAKAAASQSLAASDSATYYVVVWLEETGADQGSGTNSDASQNYIGTVTFNAVDANGNSSGVTASFS